MCRCQGGLSTGDGATRSGHQPVGVGGVGGRLGRRLHEAPLDGVVDVRFFEGFLAREAALLHTSDGQLEAALSLFGTSIEAFVRSGAGAQLVISLASLPALFQRLARTSAAKTLIGATAREEGSFHQVPGLADLADRLDVQLGEEAAERFAAAGAAMDVRDAAAYALHQIDLVRRALTTAVRTPPVLPVRRSARRRCCI
jgi:hypothetical protein